jgi:epsin
MGGFDDLWSSSLGSFGGAKSGVTGGGATGAGPKKSMADLEKEKGQASLWGGGATRSTGGGAPAAQKPDGGDFDFLM